MKKTSWKKVARFRWWTILRVVAERDAANARADEAETANLAAAKRIEKLRSMLDDAEDKLAATERELAVERRLSEHYWTLLNTPGCVMLPIEETRSVFTLAAEKADKLFEPIGVDGATLRQFTEEADSNG